MVQVEGIEGTRGTSKRNWVEVVSKNFSAYDLMKDTGVNRVGLWNIICLVDPQVGGISFVE